MKSKNKIIRTSKHTVKFANPGKRAALRALLRAYAESLQFFIDYLWNTQIITPSYDKKKKLTKVYILDVKNKWYECPSYISTVGLGYPQNGLSARMLKCCSTQACSMVRAVLEAPGRHQWILAQCLTKGEPTDRIEKKITNYHFSKPDAHSVKMELNSICADFQPAAPGGHFHGWLQLKSLGQDFGKIRIPIQYHRNYKKHAKNGKRLNSFLIGLNSIDFRWEKPAPPPAPANGTVLGGDQGLKKVMTFSNKQKPPQADPHGHTYESIHEKLARKKSGSRAFRRTQAHRKNYTNWFLNQINFDGVSVFITEGIVNIKYKRSTSRKLKHWSSPLIVGKAETLCQEKGVLFQKCDPAYRSQRCTRCGWVNHANRKGEDFCCKACGHCDDADANASQNIANTKLPKILKQWLMRKPNRKGFYWTENGFSFNGRDFYSTLFPNQTN